MRASTRKWDNRLKRYRALVVKEGHEAADTYLKRFKKAQKIVAVLLRD
jgi:hypothetical protein